MFFTYASRNLLELFILADTLRQVDGVACGRTICQYGPDDAVRQNDGDLGQPGLAISSVGLGVRVPGALAYPGKWNGRSTIPECGEQNVPYQNDRIEDELDELVL